jgi:endonuclease/exonuclease/phosphatase family metal-dependent hydrolase
MNLRITSLNICGYANWHERLPKIVNSLEEIKPDLLLLQEVRFEKSLSAFNQSQDINMLAKEPFPYANSSIAKYYRPSQGDPYREGLAVLSRYPIINMEVVALTQHLDDKHTRIAQCFEVRKDDKNILLSNVHFSNNSHSEEQLTELLHIFSARNERRIIIGDFNIFDLSAIASKHDGYRSSAQFKKYTSFPSEDKTLDYALLPGEFKFSDITTLDGSSDHSAVTFDIEL